MNLTNRLRKLRGPLSRDLRGLGTLLARDLSQFIPLFLAGIATSQTIKDGLSWRSAGWIIATMFAALWSYTEHRVIADRRPSPQSMSTVSDITPHFEAIEDLDALFRRLGPPPQDIVTLQQRRERECDGEG